MKTVYCLGMKPALDRLLSRITKTAAGCWEWTGRRFRDGYGEFNFGDGRRSVAHRAAWELLRGPIPDGLYVCHRCDNPPCVNPDHLFLGTAKDNERDKESKGRRESRAGENNGNAALTEGQVHAVRAAAARGDADEVIGERYGVAAATVRGIRTGRDWKSVPWQIAPLGPKPRGRKPKPRRTDGRLRCGRCKTDKPAVEFPPSVVKRGSGWCRGCYTAWGQTRNRVEQP